MGSQCCKASRAEGSELKTGVKDEKLQPEQFTEAELEAKFLKLLGSFPVKNERIKVTFSNKINRKKGKTLEFLALIQKMIYLISL